jgi:hypothetical protein
MAGAAKPFQGHAYNLDSSALDAYVPTASDSADLARDARWVFVSAAGDIKFNTPEGNTRTIPSVPVGLHPLPMRRLWSNGTTATILYVVV